jgi:hypothetical protein
MFYTTSTVVLFHPKNLQERRELVRGVFRSKDYSLHGANTSTRKIVGAGVYAGS